VVAVSEDRINLNWWAEEAEGEHRPSLAGGRGRGEDWVSIEPKLAVSVSAVVRRWQLEEGELETRQPSLYSSRYVLDVCGPRARRVLRVVVERLVQVEGGQEVVVDLMAPVHNLLRTRRPTHA